MHYKNKGWDLPLHSEKELAKCKSTVYTFFEAQPEIQFARDHLAEYLLYRCSKCSETIRQGLKTGDQGSTGNLREHVKKCWGEEALTAVKDSTLDKAQAAVRDFKKTWQMTLTLVVNSVTSWFKSFSTRPPEKEKICVVTACWVAESGRSFLVVRDRGFRWLQKEGRPNHYVPSNETIAQDMKKLISRMNWGLAKVLEDYEYLVPIELDCWTSPNHHAFMSIMGRIIRNGTDGQEKLTSVLLDFVELPCSHTAENMANAVEATLKDYGIREKVKISNSK
ncbi:hypothetical protein F5878DRAFT_549418 [Lentinula raphanica]|uniref:BED-type domain-containing protein n=1 Tax=Lentinula raphanica TaxID=153919 RepID=A0AA38U3F0_9AGAR|nr:hypothetical protein F5878DRAFT_549418 [Lentinula raphanica]